MGVCRIRRQLLANLTISYGLNTSPLSSVRKNVSIRRSVTGGGRAHRLAGGNRIASRVLRAARFVLGADADLIPQRAKAELACLTNSKSEARLRV
jgi:hypothetical protein